MDIMPIPIWAFAEPDEYDLVEERLEAGVPPWYPLEKEKLLYMIGIG